MSSEEPQANRADLGGFLRTQRQLANLSLRELAGLTDLSNAYLSQIERGLHEPSVRVLRSISQALDLSASSVLARAGLVETAAPTVDTEDAIRLDPYLSDAQKQALLVVYRSYRQEAETTAPATEPQREPRPAAKPKTGPSTARKRQPAKPRPTGHRPARDAT